MREISFTPISESSLIVSQGKTSSLILLEPDKRLRYSYTMNSLSSGVEVSRKNPNNRRALEINYLSAIAIEDNLSSNIPANKLSIIAKVLSSDGGTRTCALNGVFNLLNKSIKDKYYFIAFGLIDEKLIIDMNYIEDSSSEVDVPFGIKISEGLPSEYTYLQLDGQIRPEKLIEGLLYSEKEIIEAYPK